jgi:hypothetical protein
MQRTARAALIALVLTVGLVDGLPLPAPERAEQMLPGLGPVAAGAARAQALVLTPFLPLFEALRLTERWTLFAGASRERFRLEVAARRAPDGRWQLLYRADDERHRFLAELIEYPSVRGAFNPRTQDPPAGYAAFTAFVSRRLLRERPEFDEVRVRMARIRIADRGGYTPTHEYAHEIVRRREEVLP